VGLYHGAAQQARQLRRQIGAYLDSK